MNIRLPTVMALVTSLAAVARADAPAPAETWQPRCEAALRAAKEDLIARDLISETRIDVGTFGLPDYQEGEAPMVKLEYFVSHGLAVTFYVWRVASAAKDRGWRDIEPKELKAEGAMREARERGKLRAEIMAGNSNAKDVKIFRAVLRKAAEACLK